MIQSFRSQDLRKFWELGKPLPHKLLLASAILDALDFLDASISAHDLAFIGLRFDEWVEDTVLRFSVMVSERWIVSYSWNDGDAVDVDLERLA